MLSNGGDAADTNARFCEALGELADIYEVLRDPHRATAYQRAALIARQRASDTRGIGPSIAAKWVEFQQEGRLSELDKLRNDPRVVAHRTLCKMIGVGPRVAAQWIAQGVTCIADVRRAAAAGRLQLTAAQTLGMRHYEDLNTRLTRSQAEDIGARVNAVLSPLGVSTALVGSYRRGASTVGDVDILVGLPPPTADPKTAAVDSARLVAALINAIEGLPITGWILKGAQRLTFLVKCVSRRHVTHPSRGMTAQVDLLLAPPDEYPAALLYFTGSRLYNEYMRHTAKKQEMLLNQRGLYRRGEAVKVSTEEDIFTELGLPFMAPSARG